ncbi:MAG TPA: Gfo/Idh/MocA family oxidoreductase [Chloroflexota bacterium]
MSAERPLRVAVIGTGGIARLRHIPAFKRAAGLGLAELVALCDAVGASAEAAARDFGVASWATDYREVVARPDVDVVSVATPNVYHEEISIAALQAGKHVMCEKPLAMDYPGAVRMAEVARRSGRRTAVNFRYRWVPAARFLFDLVRAGEIGAVYHVYMNYLNGGRANPETPIRWRLSRAQAGSGVLGDLGSHMVDFAHVLAGPVRRVSAHLRTFTTERPVEGGGRAPVDVDDACTMVLEFASGAQGVINSSGCALGRGNHQRVELYGTGGAAIYEIERWDRGGDRLRVCLGPGQARLGAFAEVPVPPEHADSNPLDPFVDFVRAIREGRDGWVTFEDAVRVQEVLEAAERSAREGRWVDLPLEPAAAPG